MKNEKQIKGIVQGTKVVCLLSLLQQEIDLLEETGFKLKHQVKNKAGMFQDAIGRELSRLYSANGQMAVEGELKMYELINGMEIAINNEVVKFFKINEITGDITDSK